MNVQYLILGFLAAASILSYLSVGTWLLKLDVSPLSQLQHLTTTFKSNCTVTILYGKQALCKEIQVPPMMEVKKQASIVMHQENVKFIFRHL